MQKWILGGLSGLMMMGGATVAPADDIALIISNQSYRFGGQVGTNAAASQLAHDLRTRGWTVLAMGEADTAQMGASAMRLRSLMQASSDADRVIIALTGRFAQSSRDVWLLQTRSRKPDMLTAGANGLSLGALAEIASEGAAGQAIIMIGLPAEEETSGFGLRKVTGPGNLPQGVTAVTGPMSSLQAWARDSLLAQGSSLAQAVDNLPEETRARGFVSRAIGFGPAASWPQAGTAGGTGVGEMAYWNAVRDLGTSEALQAYLNRYPQGVFAAEARAQIAAQKPPDPIELAREAETALGLSRNERRQIQRHLDLLGHDPRGIDGLFGRGSRAAIAAWQKASGYDAIGFLNGAQIAELQRQADIRAAELEREARLRREVEERADRQLWQGLGRDEASLRLYLKRYPDGLFADKAQAQLDRILEKQRAAAEAKERGAWDRAVAENTIESYQRFLNRFPKGVFAEEGRKRLAELKDEVENAEARKRLQAVEDRVVPGQAARVIVEQILAGRGMKPGATDGKFTRETRRAIRRFQRENGLNVTGYVDQKTMVVLMLGRP
ncbi:peptidoglycan-binding protein [Alisedimentitalea sp. MJ-SS2]|uniref:peptidoglycan-binding protein n=1 Tax=Aliisedimentitalea sp. MJ-SS2 TaxID=3049795 RepID=UPI0029159E89|nr:peptidoglycan-binding protein [Alisedimentitalea sp. MJ-SS2]MDU8927585.1 peptidoglycan-binding protein [Alisedimentitalea sp. MJ-SS2]